MARPRKSPRDRRSCQIGVRFTPGERVRIESAADQAGVTLTEYVRSQALEGHIVVRAWRPLDPGAFEELRQLGFDLNRLTRTANGNRRLPPEMPVIAQRWNALLARIVPSGRGLDRAAAEQLRRTGVNLAQLVRLGRPLELVILERRVERLLLEAVER